MKAQQDGIVTVQILPFDADIHPCPDGGFVFLEFDAPHSRPLCSLKALLGISTTTVRVR